MSVSSPGVPVAGTGDKARDLARALNRQLAKYTTTRQCQNRLGFFGTLPDFRDVNGTLSEIDFLFSQQRLCAGVTVYTSYGGKLLGHADFKPIWARLQRYKALVFLHPSVLDITPFFIGPSIPQPIVDYPLATTRAAVDLVMTGTLRMCPDVDVVLSHAGGTIPFIAARAINSLAIPDMWSHASVNIVQAKEDFARFYYDIALSTSDAQLDGLLDFTDASHVLFGSDFPYAPQLGIDSVVRAYEAYVAGNKRGRELAPEKLRANSVRLLNKHSLGRVYS
jgi:predicted TIM-barrel fold metal-dependent hydrolase